jgi:hypothetical protein
MTTISDEAPKLAPADQELVIAAAQRFFDARLCFAVEVEQQGQNGESPERWEPRMLVLRSATIVEALGAVEETINLAPDRRIRLAGYSPALLTPAAGPALVVCSSPSGEARGGSRFSPNGERPVTAA